MIGLILIINTSFLSFWTLKSTCLGRCANNLEIGKIIGLSKLSFSSRSHQLGSNGFGELPPAVEANTRAHSCAFRYRDARDHILTERERASESQRERARVLPRELADTLCRGEKRPPSACLKTYGSSWKSWSRSRVGRSQVAYYGAAER